MADLLSEHWPYLAGTLGYMALAALRGYVKSRAEADPAIDGWDHLAAALKNVVWPWSNPQNRRK